MTHWHETALESLDQELEDGLITQTEYRNHMQDLDNELEAEAEAAAQAAYDDVMGGW